MLTGLCWKREMRELRWLCLAIHGKAFDDSREYILTAMGNTGMDETVYQPGPEQAGRTFTTVILGGRLYVETLEGVLYIKAEEAELFIYLQ